MKENKRLIQGLSGSLLFIAILWCIKSAEILLGIHLSFLGLTPHSVDHLLGIATAPLIHGSLEHIFNNTLAILLLGTALYYGYPKSWKKVVCLVWLLSGIGVWLFAREANHIGASGLTHGVFFFLLVASMFRRDKSSVAIMMIAFLMYGGMTMSIFPRSEAISFEYHLFGALVGMFAAFVWKDLDPKPVEKKYDWESEEHNALNQESEDWQSEHVDKNQTINRTLH